MLDYQIIAAIKIGYSFCVCTVIVCMTDYDDTVDITYYKIHLISATITHDLSNNHAMMKKYNV